jgi:hypothetical protein
MLIIYKDEEESKEDPELNKMIEKGNCRVLNLI